jgi:hypothetical protein
MNNFNKLGLISSLGIKFDNMVDTIFNMGDVVHDIATGAGEWKDTGSVGERMTYNALREHFPNSHIFRNVYLTRADGKTTEIDMLVIDRRGIFVLESKNYGGWIFGDSSQKYWTATYPNKLKNRFYNPILQNLAHIRVVQERLSESYPNLKYFSLIVFSERCELKKIKNDEPNTFIFKRPETHYWINKILRANKNSVLADEEVKEICNWLRPHERPDEEIKQTHIASLKAAANTCPWCNSELIERTNRKTGAAFIGCSTYPKCKYTTNK